MRDDLWDVTRHIAREIDNHLVSSISVWVDIRIKDGISRMRDDDVSR
jgi:hypothetical protein